MNQEAFANSTNEFRGYVQGKAHHVEKLTFKEKDLIDADAEEAGWDGIYVVYSYKTPIAWRLPDGRWRLLERKFSRTTTGHQTLVRQALANVPESRICIVL